MMSILGAQSIRFLDVRDVRAHACTFVRVDGFKHF